MHWYGLVKVDGEDLLGLRQTSRRYLTMEQTEISPHTRDVPFNADNSTTEAPTETKLALINSLLSLCKDNTPSGMVR
jgi:hypothetical protein